MKGDQRPALQEDVLFRTQDQIQLFDKVRVNDTVPRVSADIECAPFRKFGLYVYIDSTTTPTTLQIKVQFLDPWSGQWYDHKQGLFAALFYEDGDTASGIYEVFVGDVAGRAMRVVLVGVGTSSTAYFTTSIAVDFWN
jgi:hypothetical protein